MRSVLLLITGVKTFQENELWQVPDLFWLMFQFVTVCEIIYYSSLRLTSAVCSAVITSPILLMHLVVCFQTPVVSLAYRILVSFSSDFTAFFS